jgi:hypothetical protein
MFEIEGIEFGKEAETLDHEEERKAFDLLGQGIRVGRKN